MLKIIAFRIQLGQVTDRVGTHANQMLLRTILSDNQKLLVSQSAGIRNDNLTFARKGGLYPSLFGKVSEKISTGTEQAKETDQLNQIKNITIPRNGNGR